MNRPKPDVPRVSKGPVPAAGIDGQKHSLETGSSAEARLSLC